MTTATDLVRAEYTRFRSMLPTLLETHRGKFVLFLNGSVVTSADREDDAYREGIRRFGSEGGFVVAKVREERDLPLTGAISLGVSCGI